VVVLVVPRKVVVTHGPIVSPCLMWAGHAWTLTVSVAIGCHRERVWWQIVTRPVAGTVVPVVPVVTAAVLGLLANPTPTRTPDAARTATATAPPIALRARRLNMRRSFGNRAPKGC
jgi:hypothetical protein